MCWFSWLLPVFSFLYGGVVVFFFLACTCRVLVSQPGIKSVPTVVEAQSLNHWTSREAPCRSGLLEVLILPFQKCFSCGVHGICFDLIDSLPFETLPVMVRTTWHTSNCWESSCWEYFTIIIWRSISPHVSFLKDSYKWRIKGGKKKLCQDIREWMVNQKLPRIKISSLNPQN